MPKLRKIASHTRPGSGAPLDARQQGLRAFHAGRYDEAVRLWTPLATRDEQARAALAEAHFRLALKATDADKLAHLRQAAALAPGDLRYQYHLGMQWHHAGDLAAAAASYRAIVAQGGLQGAALLLALAELEQNARVDLAALPGSTAEIRAALAPVQALLSGSPLPDTAGSGFIAQLRRALDLGQANTEAVGTLWRGLSQIAARDKAAADTLADPHPLPHPRLTAIRRNYLGVALALTGDMEAALAQWQQTYASGTSTAALLDNLTAALHARLVALIDAGDMEAAAALAQQTVGMPIANPALNDARIQALDQMARATAAGGDWARAAELWESARQIVSSSQGLGSPRPFWHNLALAYEAQERWIEAAEAWRGMLRTRPRRRGAAQDEGPTDAQWSWVRKRVIECYKLAGQPGEAVTVFRQIIKAEPNDLDARLQLADALLANGQEQAAHNEVQRILQIDPHFADAQARHATLLNARGYIGAAQQALRDAVTQHPERDDLRRQFTRMLLDHVGHYIGHGMDSAAEPLLIEGQQLEPENEQFALNLARVRFNQRRPDEARAFLERVLELAGDRPEPYMNVFQCWVIERDLEAARAVIERAEAALTPPAEFYGQLGVMAITETTPPPPMLNPFLPFSAQPKQPPTDTPWTEFGRALLERAVEQRPGDPRLRLLIATGLMGPRPDLAQPHADEAARLAPDDPNMQILRGVVLALNDRKREAKEQLRKAAALARKRGERNLAAQADDMRREIDSPFFRAAFQMHAMLGELDDELDELF